MQLHHWVNYKNKSLQINVAFTEGLIHRTGGIPSADLCVYKHCSATQFNKSSHVYFCVVVCVWHVLHKSAAQILMLHWEYSWIECPHLRGQCVCVRIDTYLSRRTGGYKLLNPALTQVHSISLLLNMREKLWSPFLCWWNDFRYWGTSKVKSCQNRKAGSAQLTNLCYKSETRFAPMWRNLNLWSSLLIRNKGTCHPLGYIFDTDAVSSLEKLQVSVHISAVISRNVTCLIVSTLLAAVIGVTQVTGAFLTNPISLHPPATSAVLMVELVEEASRSKWKASYCVFLPSWCSHLLKVSWQSNRVHSRCYF